MSICDLLHKTKVKLCKALSHKTKAKNSAKPQGLKGRPSRCMLNSVTIQGNTTKQIQKHTHTSLFLLCPCLFCVVTLPRIHQSKHRARALGLSITPTQQEAPYYSAAAEQASRVCLCVCYSVPIHTMCPCLSNIDSVHH